MTGLNCTDGNATTCTKCEKGDKTVMFMRSVLAIVFASFLTGNATAEESDECGCVTPRAASGIGNIISSTGDVFMSSDSGFSAVTAGQKISENAEIIVGCQAVAQIKVGQTCDLLLSAGSEVQILASGAKLCVRASDTAKNCGSTTTGSGTLSSAKAQTNGATGFGLPELGFLGTAAVMTNGFLWDDGPPPPPASP